MTSVNERPAGRPHSTFLCLTRRPTRAQRKSVIAEALRYEAVQGTPATDAVDATPSPQYNACLEQAQTSVFSAFGKGPSSTLDNPTTSSRLDRHDITHVCL